MLLEANLNANELCALAGGALAPVLGLLGDFVKGRQLLSLRGAFADDVLLPQLAPAREALSTPGLVGRVDVEERGMVTRRWLLATPELTCAVRPLENGSFAVAAFETHDFLAELATISQLAQSVSATGELTTSTARMGAALALGPDAEEKAVGLLTAAGTAGPAETQFLRALRDRVRTVQVQLLHAVTATSLEGAEVTWLDGGAYGLWNVPAFVEAMITNDDYVVSATTAERLMCDLAEGLPAPTGS